ncbi:MAG: right-handed parallel beta-helix repeat-containing protein [Sedimentisphaerales bacterium]|nr:right-handed parallel beta-helix repeat-containing protein [Sedimentisphaerales bacterium]
MDKKTKKLHAPEECGTWRRLAVRRGFFLIIAAFILLAGSWSYACTYNGEDFALFAKNWRQCCNPDNGWCDGYDYDSSGILDLKDLSGFVDLWLVSDNPPLIGGTKGTATFLVAASNADPTVKQVADYVCDREADEVQIQAAIDRLTSVGGVVYLSAGSFYVNNSIILKQKVGLVGVSMGNTLIYLADGAETNVIEWSPTEDEGFAFIRQMKIIGDCEGHIGHGIHITDNDGYTPRDMMIDHVYTRECAQDGMHFDNGTWGLKIWNSISEHNIGCGINMSGYSQINIFGTFIAYNQGIAGIKAVNSELIISGCDIFQNCQHGIYSYGQRVVINANVFNGNSVGSEGTYSAIKLNYTGDDTKIIGNSFDGKSREKYGIELNADSCVVVGNTFEDGSFVKTPIIDSGVDNIIRHNAGYKASVTKLITLDWNHEFNTTDPGSQNGQYGQYFDDSSDEYVVLTGFVPNDFRAGTAALFKWRWAPTNDQVCSRVVRFNTRIAHAPNSGVIPDSPYYLPQNENLAVCEAAQTIHESCRMVPDLSAGDFVSITLKREASHMNDTCMGDIFMFLNVFLEYTADEP